METTKNKLPEDVELFLSNLKTYLDLPIYFYGSVQRSDFVKGSDIDIAIFTDNESSTIEKMSHYLHMPKSQFTKTLSNHNNDQVIYGYITKYKKLSCPIDFTIYTNKYKKEIIHDYTLRFNLPLYISGLLIILKFIHYKMHAINMVTYNRIKKQILTTFIGKSPDLFIRL
jgi:hypothetical protein